MTEHIKYASDGKIIYYLSIMLKICIKVGVIPKCLSSELLIPVLKKSTLDPQLPQNYRPITISSTLSKLMELYILDMSGIREFSDLQFVIPGRGTSMASSFIG